jgi:hypothetical protein
LFSIIRITCGLNLNYTKNSIKSNKFSIYIKHSHLFSVRLALHAPPLGSKVQATAPAHSRIQVAALRIHQARRTPRISQSHFPPPLALSTIPTAPCASPIPTAPADPPIPPPLPIIISADLSSMDDLDAEENLAVALKYRSMLRRGLDFNSFLEDEDIATTSLAQTPISNGELAGTGGRDSIACVRRGGRGVVVSLGLNYHTTGGRGVARLSSDVVEDDRSAECSIATSWCEGVEHECRAGRGLVNATLGMASALRDLGSAFVGCDIGSTSAVTSVTMSERYAWHRLDVYRARQWLHERRAWRRHTRPRQWCGFCSRCSINCSLEVVSLCQVNLFL